MGSQAIANDYNRYKVSGGREGRFNPQVMTSKQDGSELAPNDEWQKRKDEERILKRQLREAEGGRGGGFNDRQVVEKKEVAEEDSEFDEYGRRKKKATIGASKAERARLALERLKPKKTQATDEDERGARREST